jgi:hypothetical protein
MNKSNRFQKQPVKDNQAKAIEEITKKLNTYPHGSERYRVNHVSRMTKTGSIVTIYSPICGSNVGLATFDTRKGTVIRVPTDDELSRAISDRIHHDLGIK